MKLTKYHLESKQVFEHKVKSFDLLRIYPTGKMNEDQRDI